MPSPGVGLRGARLFNLRCLICRAGETWCALPLSEIAEVMRALPVQPVAGAPSFVAGVAVVRGRAVPVVDLGRLMTGEATAYGRFIRLRAGADGVVLAVAELGGTHPIDVDRLGELPPLLRDAVHVRALAALDGRLLHVLEGARLVELGRVAAMARGEA